VYRYCPGEDGSWSSKHPTAFSSKKNLLGSEVHAGCVYSSLVIRGVMKIPDLADWIAEV
jgi:hypothetical protein